MTNVDHSVRVCICSGVVCNEWFGNCSGHVKIQNLNLYTEKDMAYKCVVIYFRLISPIIIYVPVALYICINEGSLLGKCKNIKLELHSKGRRRRRS